MVKRLGKTKALEMLRKLKHDLACEVRERFEHKARSCGTCDTPGACCLDAHFVNVRITRLEAEAMAEVIRGLQPIPRHAVIERIRNAVERYALELDNGPVSVTYACPLFDRKVGCLVHDTAKPAACIVHACYENEQDLPPESVLDGAESRIARLERQVYGAGSFIVSIPAALQQVLNRDPLSGPRLDDAGHRQTRGEPADNLFDELARP